MRAAAHAEVFEEAGSDKVPIDENLKRKFNIYLDAWTAAFLVVKEKAERRKLAKVNETLYQPLAKLISSVKTVGDLMELKGEDDQDLIGEAKQHGTEHLQEMKAILQATACRHQRTLGRHHEAIGAISEILRSPVGTIAARSNSTVLTGANKELADCGKEYKNLSLKA